MTMSSYDFDSRDNYKVFLQTMKHYPNCNPDPFGHKSVEGNNNGVSFTGDCNFDIVAELPMLEKLLEQSHTVKIDRHFFEPDENGKHKTHKMEVHAGGVYNYLECPFKNMFISRQGVPISSMIDLPDGMSIEELDQVETQFYYHIHNLYHLIHEDYIYLYVSTTRGLSGEISNAMYKIPAEQELEKYKTTPAMRWTYTFTKKILSDLLDPDRKYVIEREPFRYKIKLEGKKAVIKGSRSNLTVYTGRSYKLHNKNKSIKGDPKSRHFVMGHWRKLEDNKLGKNFNGEYCIPNMTWVTQHIRGDFGTAVNKDRKFKKD